MTDRELDILIQRAFGDDDGGSVTAAATPEAQRTFGAFQQLREDLRSLDDNVPECQLSIERVRHAILKGAQARPPRRIWGFVSAAGLAAATVYFAWIGMNAGSASTPNTVADATRGASEPLVVASQLTDSAAARTLGSDVSDKLRSFAKPALTESAEESSVAPSMRSSRSARPSSSRTRMDRRFGGAPDTAVPEAPGSSDLAMPATATVTEEIPVVVVSGTADPETGASTAKEVVNSDHVVFGG